MIKKMDYSLVHERHQHLQNYIYKQIHTTRSWPRKVDDTFVITKYDKIETLDQLNKFSKVQFTL